LEQEENHTMKKIIGGITYEATILYDRTTLLHDARVQAAREEVSLNKWIMKTIKAALKGGE
jgi:hypothetical protein